MKAIVTDNKHLHIEVVADTPLAVARTILFLGDPSALTRHLPLLTEAYGLDFDAVSTDLATAETGTGEPPAWFRATTDGPFTLHPTFTADNGDTISGHAHVTTTLDLGGLLGAMQTLCTDEAATQVREKLEVSHTTSS